MGHRLLELIIYAKRKKKTYVIDKVIKTQRES